MRLSQLKEILTKVESMGFVDEEIEVKFMNSFTVGQLEFVDTRFQVTTTEKNCRPTVVVNLKSKSVGE